MDGIQAISQEQAKFTHCQPAEFLINNQTKASVMTEQAIGRVMDADFAAETTALSKQQILNQAAINACRPISRSNLSLPTQ